MEGEIENLRMLLVQAEPDDSLPPSIIQLDQNVVRTLDADSWDFPAQLRLDPAAHYLLALRSAASRRTQAAHLRKLARFLGATDWHQVDWAGLGYSGANAVLARLAADEPTAAAFNGARAALRGVFHQAFMLNQIGHEVFLRVQSIKGERVPRDKEPAGRYLSSGELELLLSNCRDNTNRGSRDSAIVGCLAFAGLRRSEAAALEIDDIQLGQEIRVRRGKGRVPRKIPLIALATRLLEAWLQVRGTGPGALFRRISWKDRILDGGITDQTIYDVVRARSPLNPVSPHDLRRTFVSNLLAASLDLNAARRLAGHSSTDTTAIYDRRAEIADRLAMEKLSEKSAELGT